MDAGGQFLVHWSRIARGHVWLLWTHVHSFGQSRHLVQCCPGEFLQAHLSWTGQGQLPMDWSRNSFQSWTTCESRTVSFEIHSELKSYHACLLFLKTRMTQGVLSRFVTITVPDNITSCNRPNETWFQLWQQDPQSEVTFLYDKMTFQEAQRVCEHNHSAILFEPLYINRTFGIIISSEKYYRLTFVF